MRVALDLSSRATGWATWCEGAQDPKWGILRLPASVNDCGPTNEGLRRHLADLYAVEPIKTIFYEAQYIGTRVNMDVAEKLLGMAGMVDWFAHKVGANVFKVPVSSWRKHFYLSPPKGERADLKRMGVIAAHRRGWMVSKDDEADALGVLDYGLHCVGVKPPWAERHLFGGRLST